MPRKQPAFGIGEDDPPTTEARLEQAVLGFQVFDERFLLSDEPCSEYGDLKLHQRRRLRHAASLYQAAPPCSLDLGRVSGHYGIHSYVDTQLRRLGGPNFHEMPINALLRAAMNIMDARAGRRCDTAKRRAGTERVPQTRVRYFVSARLSQSSRYSRR